MCIRDRFYRILAESGILIFKCQDKVSSGTQYLSHVFIINQAISIGFYPVDIFVLLAKSRLTAKWQLKNQRHARKFHSYFLVLKKSNKRVKYTDIMAGGENNGKIDVYKRQVEQDGDANAYCTFISMLCEFAKNQSRINRKPDTSDNSKYTMRCFLIRLGMVGAEFKAARKVILRHLSGNSAFRKVGDTDAVSE